MSVYDAFIPGQWFDEIDVNDFVSLNKKPFLEKPIFLKKSSSDTVALFEKIKRLTEDEKWNVIPEYSSLRDHRPAWIDKRLEKIPGFQSGFEEKKIGYGEDRSEMMDFFYEGTESEKKENRPTNAHLFERVSTGEMQKLIRMGIFEQTAKQKTISYVQPDVRRVALYGTKRLIEERKQYFKSLEKHVQNHEWIQKRMGIHEEIQALKELERFAKKYGVDASEPAKQAKDVFQMVYLVILACAIENPSVPFALGQVVEFLDIFVERDIKQKIWTEEEAQEWMEQFYIKLLTIRFTLSPGYLSQEYGHPVFLGESFGFGGVTKSTYRFLEAAKRFSSFPFALRVWWDYFTPDAFKVYCEELLNAGVPLSIGSYPKRNDKREWSSYGNGQYGIPGEMKLYHAGVCDLTKLFRLAINGGRDVETNINVLAVVQPIRKKEMEYEEAFVKFKDFFSYILSIFAEMATTGFYIQDVHAKHPIRNALLSNVTQNKITFQFLHIEKLAHLLSSIKERKYKIELDEKGWVRDVIPFGKGEHKQEIVAKLVQLAQQELEKIPMYGRGKVDTCFLQKGLEELQTADEIKEAVVLPKEITTCVFPVNGITSRKEGLAEWIERLIRSGFSEINVSTNPEALMINGVLYSRTHPFNQK